MNQSATRVLRPILRYRTVDKAEVAAGKIVAVIIAEAGGVEYSTTVVIRLVTGNCRIFDGESALIKYAAAQISGIFRDGAVNDTDLPGRKVFAIKVERTA